MCVRASNALRRGLATSIEIELYREKFVIKRVEDYERPFVVTRIECKEARPVLKYSDTGIAKHGARNRIDVRKLWDRLVNRVLEKLSSGDPRGAGSIDDRSGTTVRPRRCVSGTNYVRKKVAGSVRSLR